jgi:hypothetical protein
MESSQLGTQSEPVPTEEELEVLKAAAFAAMEEWINAMIAAGKSQLDVMKAVQQALTQGD